MSSVPPDPHSEPSGAPDDTAAFSRFYLGDPDGRGNFEDVPARGLLYRLLIGWWRDR